MHHPTTRPNRTAKTALFSVVSLAAALVSYAEKISQTDSITVTLENDVFAGTDADYTAGTEIAWSFAAKTSFDDLENLPQWCVSLAQMTPLGKRQYDTVGSNIAIGQKIYTPRDLSRSELIEDDRPYTGWTYLNFALHGRKADRLDSFSISLGVVGPDSFAEDIQRGIHELIDDADPQGWDNQLNNEIGVVANFQQDRRRWRWQNENDLGSELVETRSLSLGNVDTSLSYGYRLRLGKNLPSDFLSGRIRNSQPGLAPLSEKSYIPNRPRRFFLEAAATGSYVAHNIFLDGNTFEDSHSVDKRKFTGEASLGLGFETKGMRLSLLYTFRTEEFTTQDGGSSFGSLAMSFR